MGYPDFAAHRRRQDTADRLPPLECGCRDGEHRACRLSKQRDDGGAHIYDNLPMRSHWRVDTAAAERRLGHVDAPMPYPPHRGDAA